MEDMTSTPLPCAAGCLSCLARQAEEAAAMCAREESERKAIVRKALDVIADAHWTISPVGMSQRLHRVIRDISGNPDPYASVKSAMNRLAMELLPDIQTDPSHSEGSPDSVVRIAIAGNLLDSGAKTSMPEQDVRSAMRRLFADPLVGSVQSLFISAATARQILYLTDNAGEIVFDRLLIKALPAEKMFVGVRGSPVLNDATEADAAVAGLPQIVPVLPNGSDAPGTLIEDCSEEFRRIFETSDLVIAKGQGNYESLCTTDKHIFFLLRVKCPVVAEHIGAPIGTMMIREMNGSTFAQNCSFDQDEYDSDYVR